MRKNDIDKFREARSRVYAALHHLWTQYTVSRGKTPGPVPAYNKKDWIELDNAITVLVGMAEDSTT